MPENKTNRQYYTAAHLLDEHYYQFPKWLIEDPEFSQLSNDAKVLYTFLKDRFRLSAKNRWIDKQGRVFVICKRETMEATLHKSKNTITKIVGELTKKNLIEDVQNGKTRPNFIYLLMPEFKEEPAPEFEEDDWVNDDYFEDDPAPEEVSPKNWDSGLPEKGIQGDSQELTPSKNNFSVDESVNSSFFPDTEDIPGEKFAEREKEINHFDEFVRSGKPFRYLGYLDLFEIMARRVDATNCETALSGLNIPEAAQGKIIKSFLALMADILTCEDEYYSVGKKKYKRKDLQQRLLLLDHNLFYGVLMDLEEVDSIHSMKPYMTELLYNAAINSSSNVLKKKSFG